MTIGSILLGVALAVLVGLVLARPLLQASREEQVRLSQRQLLLAEKEAILAQIRELDFDHDTGKMPDEIHQHQRTQLMSSAAAILKQIEELDGTATPAIAPAVNGVDGSGDVDDDIEAAIARMRQAPKVKTAPRPQPAAASGSGFCPQCGTPFDPGDKFCVSCGHKLRTKQAVR
ncbi:MAG: zinc ribbon domain-containing protein [Ardenticatenaceae bacterium]|nr:zinc ribbon domain-containing protein [Ardenticatenaceae bacterium]MCB9443676.1 zinc ribbon domain-containing protein [Ardenticatenaceae bacterium]